MEHDTPLMITAGRGEQLLLGSHRWHTGNITAGDLRRTGKTRTWGNALGAQWVKAFAGPRFIEPSDISSSGFGSSWLETIVLLRSPKKTTYCYICCPMICDVM